MLGAVSTKDMPHFSASIDHVLSHWFVAVDIDFLGIAGASPSEGLRPAPLGIRDHTRLPPCYGVWQWWRWWRLTLWPFRKPGLLTYGNKSNLVHPVTSITSMDIWNWVYWHITWPRWVYVDVRVAYAYINKCIWCNGSGPWVIYCVVRTSDNSTRLTYFSKPLINRTWQTIGKNSLSINYPYKIV